MPAIDRFATRAAGPDGPAVRCFAVTPHASDELVEVVRALYVGASGDVAIVDPEGSTVTFKAVPGGTILPVRARAVRSPATTATDLVGLV